MRINTGTRTATSVNFVNGQAGGETVWDVVFTETAEWYIEDMIEAHLATGDEYGQAEVFDYQECGLWVTALMIDGHIATVITVTEDDLMRVHTALMTGRELSIRYVKADGEVTRRRVQPQSLRFSKAGDAILRATDNRRDGDTRSFRWDRVTHTTLHRAVRRPAPTKSALWAEFERTLPQPETAAPAPVEGQVRHTGRDYTGRVVEGTRAFGPSGWSVIVKLDAEYAHLTPGGTVRASEDELEAWCTAVTDVYLTTPGTAAALEAPESVQDQLAERYALGHAYAFVTA